MFAEQTRYCGGIEIREVTSQGGREIKFRSICSVPSNNRMTSSGETSPLSITPAGTPLSNQAPKYGTLIPNRIFVGGIAANEQQNEQELKQFFSAYGAVKDCKIIADRAGVSKGYGFVTFETQEDAEKIIKKEADNLIFKDRKLNIGPAIRKQQAFPKLYEQNMVSGPLSGGKKNTLSMS